MIEIYYQMLTSSKEIVIIGSINWWKKKKMGKGKKWENKMKWVMTKKWEKEKQMGTGKTRRGKGRNK